MALPSQSARPIRIRAGGGSKRRRRKRGGGFIIGLILISVAGGATWWLWPESDTETETKAVDTVADHAAGTLTMEVAGVDPTGSTPARAPAPTPAPGATANTEVGTATPRGLSTVPTPPPTSADANAGGLGTADAQTPQPSSLTALEEAATLMRADKPIDARVVLSKALMAPSLAPADAEHLRATLASINESLVFSREIAIGDPFVGLYTIKGGDSLSLIVDREDLPINWRFLQRLNGIAKPGHIGVGQRLKTITTPFHAIINKQDHRLDLWLGEGEDAVYVRSFSVGLGEFDSTPHGLFRVRKGGKLVNPSWRNPRTGEYFQADDPKNPIGEFWISLRGIEAHNLDEKGFGVHGTIDPDSIGADRSLGCVRLGNDDIELLYGVLASGKSTVLVE